MPLKFKVKVVFVAEDNEYICFIEGMKGVEGYGTTEEEAVEDFKRRLERATNEG